MPPPVSCFYHQLSRPQTESMTSGTRCIVKAKPISFIIAQKCSQFQSDVKIYMQVNIGGKNVSILTFHSRSSVAIEIVYAFLHPIHRNQRNSRLDSLIFVRIAMQIRCTAELLARKSKFLSKFYHSRFFFVK